MEKLGWWNFVVQSLSRVQLFMTPWTVAHQAPLSSTISWSLLKLMPIELVILSNHLTLCWPLQSFPASGSFPMSWLFASGGQSTGVSASASVLPINIQDCFLLGLIGLISLQSRGLSRGFSRTTVWKHKFLSVLQCSAFFIELSQPYMTTGKTIALTRWTFVAKVMSLLFNACLGLS